MLADAVAIIGTMVRLWADHLDKFADIHPLLQDLVFGYVPEWPLLYPPCADSPFLPPVRSIGRF